MTTKTVTVPNISCGHCTHTIEMEVGDVTGVSSVKADEATKQVVIEWDDPATWEEIETLMTEINYPPNQ
ncbi:MAG: cation transporter [Caldilineaceae bacterium]|nr:cation transporter [Caldilineaceae bacterium]MCB9139336.1 cation transporter [Caldilineaceae bacterium]